MKSLKDKKFLGYLSLNFLRLLFFSPSHPVNPGHRPLHNPPGESARYEERLAEKVTDGGPGAVEAALELLERRQPATFLEAVKLVCGDGPCAAAAFDAIADAWGTYHVVRDMPWD